eukprot:1614703-Prymnesium_polylepis.2
MPTCCDAIKIDNRVARRHVDALLQDLCRHQQPQSAAKLSHRLLKVSGRVHPADGPVVAQRCAQEVGQQPAHHLPRDKDDDLARLPPTEVRQQGTQLWRRVGRIVDVGHGQHCQLRQELLPRGAQQRPVLLRPTYPAAIVVLVPHVDTLRVPAEVVRQHVCGIVEPPRAEIASITATDAHNLRDALFPRLTRDRSERCGAACARGRRMM